MLENYIKTSPEWLNAKGEEADIAISSRIRLARNIKDIPFAHWAPMNDLEKVTKMIEEAISRIPSLKNADIIRQNDLIPLQKQFLVERHLVSPEHTNSKLGSVIVSEREIISIMINEEDHLRMQVLSSGLNLVDSWQIIAKVEEELSAILPFAFSFDFGYLTACPTNVGTGMRASIMLHLPALSLSNKIEKIIPFLSKVGMVSRGFYGEKSETFGDLFQVSNQITLGKKEEELIEALIKVIRQIIDYEKEERELLRTRGGIQIEDRFKRAYGLLVNAKLIPSREAMELLSIIRLGIHLGFLPSIPTERLNRLLVFTQPAHLQLAIGGASNPALRDRERAELIQRELEIR
ncbi:MAG: protein arginine kinase [bacterium]